MLSLSSYRPVPPYQEVGQGPMVGVPGRWVIARLSLVLEPWEVSPWMAHYIPEDDWEGQLSSSPDGILRHY